MSPLFKISKNNETNKKQKFINPGMGDVPVQNGGVIAPGGSNNETFVYDSMPKPNMGGNNVVNNNYPNGGMNQMPNYSNPDNSIQQKRPSAEELMMPKSVQPPKLKNEPVIEELDLPEEKLEELDEVEALEENKVELDPLNNANNPVPVNPVAPKEEVVEEELPEDVKANLFSAIGMMFGMFFAPGTTIIKNSKRYKSITKALTVTLWISLVSIILCMAARIVVGMFSVKYNSVTGASTVSLTFINMFDLDNYTPYLLVAFIMSFGAIAVAALVYYASSFLNSKGVHMGTYFMVSSLAMVPVIVGVLVLYPIINIFSQYAAILVFVFTFLYTLISFFIGMNEVLTFGNINRRILYNVINLSLIFMIIVIIFLLCYRLNILIPPEFHV